MKTMRDTYPVKVGCSDLEHNIFYATLSDGRDFVMRQPRAGDRREQKLAWREISERNKRRYRRRDFLQSGLYDMNKRCRFPVYKGEFPGMLPLSVELEERVIGFCDIFFRLGDYFPEFKVEPTDKCANGGIVALDKYLGYGVGHYYAVVSNYIAKHYGCQWILGRTFMRGGMRQIRAKEDPPWEIIWTDGKLVDHRKPL